MRSWVAVLFLTATLVPSTAFARPSARLTVEGGPRVASCPSEDELRRAVLERLGYDALRRDAVSEVRVAFAAEEAGGFSARISHRDETRLAAGERLLTDLGPDCSALGEAVVLTISVLLESPRLPARNDSGSAPIESPTGKVAPDEPVSAAPIRPGARVRLRSEGTLGIGIAPAPAPGLSLAAGIASGALSIDLEGRADAAAEDSIPGGRVRTSLRMLQLVPCWHASAFAGCAIAGGGAMTMEGVDVTNARAESRFHAVGGLRAALEAPLGKGFFFSAHADALLVFTRTSANVGSREVYGTAPFGALFAAGAGYVFP